MAVRPRSDARNWDPTVGMAIDPTPFLSWEVGAIWNRVDMNGAWTEKRQGVSVCIAYVIHCIESYKLSNVTCYEMCFTYVRIVVIKHFTSV